MPTVGVICPRWQPLPSAPRSSASFFPSHSKDCSQGSAARDDSPCRHNSAITIIEVQRRTKHGIGTICIHGSLRGFQPDPRGAIVHELEGAPPPAEFTARIRNEYGLESLSRVIANGDDVEAGRSAVHRPPSNEYSKFRMGAPPLNAGASNATKAVPELR